jgi:dephospho-CoA kinase
VSRGSDLDSGSGSAVRPAGGLGRPVHIGITGPIGCGKSTVAGWLGELGAVVIDADQVARDVSGPGSRALRAVVREFGPTVLNPHGTLDRATLGRIVFADPAALRRLEAILHPAVRPRILDLLLRADGSQAPAIVIEAIKLVEGGLASLCDEVWLVTCDPAAQRERLLTRELRAGRNGDPADTEARIGAQADLVERLTSSATRIVDTSGTVAETRTRAAAAFDAALAARR